MLRISIFQPQAISITWTDGSFGRFVVSPKNGLSKPRSSEPYIGSRDPANARCIVACQSAQRYNPLKRQLTSGSQVQIGGSSRANGNTSHKSQPCSGLQGPKLTAKEGLDAKNKTEVPVPAEKIEEDAIRENLKIAKRKLQERLQKSEQGEATVIENLLDAIIKSDKSD